ncbi:MAG TPA: IS200/IS605 family transposase [Ignavibacteria bacterium]|nr:IS200/IS605 family transposase [Ignavibacteria bacterium]
MANTFTQINIHLIFAVQGRENILRNSFRENLFKYIYGILRESKQYPLAVNGYLDHVHAFFELNPINSVSDIARIVKANSSKWINENKFVRNKFHWQKGYGAFSYSRSQRDNVIKYIMEQEKHHKKKTFREEYLEFLKAFNVKYDERYLFKWIDIN